MYPMAKKYEDAHEQDAHVARNALADYLLSKNKGAPDMLDTFSKHLQYLLELEQEPVKQVPRNRLLTIYYKNTPYFYDTQSQKILEILPDRRKKHSP
jgi:hypothetical protein